MHMYVYVGAGEFWTTHIAYVDNVVRDVANW